MIRDSHMKRFFLLTLVLMSICLFSVYGQFKSKEIFQPSIKDGITNNSSGLILNFFNPENFSMNHSYSLSYNTFGGNGIALGVYTNRMMYSFTPDLNVEVDASIMHSPYNSFGNNMQNQLSGIYLSRAALNYRPWKNFHINVQYQNLPAGYFNPYYNPLNGIFNNPFQADFGQ